WRAAVVNAIFGYTVRNAGPGAGPPCRGIFIGITDSMHLRIAIYLFIPLAFAASEQKTAAPKGGIKTPGVQIPAASLKPAAEIRIAPEWIGRADALLIPDAEKGTLDRIDPKTNTIAQPVAGVAKPCGGAISAFGSVWVPSCADHSLVRLDAKKWEVTARI